MRNADSKYIWIFRKRQQLKCHRFYARNDDISQILYRLWMNVTPKEDQNSIPFLSQSVQHEPCLGIASMHRHTYIHAYEISSKTRLITYVRLYVFIELINSYAKCFNFFFYFSFGRWNCGENVSRIEFVGAL